jgi:Sulfotransferase family
MPSIGEHQSAGRREVRDFSHRARPNLFIVGAAKSGTTAMASFLGDHPDIFMAPWELNYFGKDLDFRKVDGAPWRIPIEQYLGVFAYHHAELYRGDHSVFSLYSKTAAREILEFDPGSRIIVMLRNPVDQMQSQHSEMLFQGEEDIEEFEVALEAEHDRRLGKRIPPGCTKPFALQYRSLSRYADQVDRFISAFGRDRVCVLLHDDLVRDPAGSYSTVLKFLDLDPSHEPQLRVVNANKTVRWGGLRDALRDTEPRSRARLRSAGRLLVPNPSARARLRRRLHSWNTKRAPRDPIVPALRRSLLSEASEDIQRLEKVIERDLGEWLNPK